MTDATGGPGDISKRAMELAARAEELARHAHETADIDEQLARLEAEMDALDAEEAALNRGVDDEPGRHDEPPAAPRWADQLTERVGSLGDRIGALVEQVTEAALQHAGDALTFDTEASKEDVAVDVDGPGVVRIDSSGGSLQVRGHDHNAVTVTATGRRLRDEDRLIDVTVDKDGVRIATCEPRRRRIRGIHLDVRVPVGTELAAVTAGGSITVDGTGGAVDVRTGGGSLRVRGARQRAALSTGGGSIDVDDHDGSITARTGGGSVRIDGRLTGTCSVETGGGNLTVRLLDGSNLHVEARGIRSVTDVASLRSEHGHISGDVGDAAGGRLDARTGGGTVRIIR